MTFKRFVFKQPRTGIYVVTVDEADAYLLRSGHWFLTGTGTGHTPRLARWAAGSCQEFGHFLLDASANQEVRHLNGVALDYRRENLWLAPLRKKKAPHSGGANTSEKVATEQPEGQA